ncbi:MAG: L-2-amino-thiazoline-4-carboxylic acid hydrolase [Deltaproteobacteria bacterium]|nr:L-2-amino-thiazoline-4-carboxylic acid hydrolase [Deltaproteobacteria bacterium]MBW1944829.1 L-2-amino-thiazoline-4-carboxylic acid hydrolase [Deltaproteobacteria bacterium]
MKLSDEQLLELAQYAFVRMDGAWFLALARELGVDTAFKMDVEAWTQFSYVFGKKIRKEFIPEPIWPESFMEAMKILTRILKIEGREVKIARDTITVRVTDCEIQKAIAKAGVADCGIATIATYKGVARGLFGKDMEISVEHTRNLNQGDPYCEVVITR